MDEWMDTYSFKYLMEENTRQNMRQFIMLRDKARMSIISTTFQHCTQGIHCTMVLVNTLRPEKSIRGIEKGRK